MKHLPLIALGLLMTFNISTPIYAASDYSSSKPLSGSLTSIGSDTLEKLMESWAEIYKHHHPDMSISLTAKGSSTAPPALISGESSLGPMSRKMKKKEVNAFLQKYGYKPTAIRVAVDAIGIFVHKDNPTKGLSMHQVDAIFSSTRKCGAPTAITQWSEVGASSLADIKLYGRNNLSGTYGFFKKKALCKGEYSPTLTEEKGSALIAEKIAADVNASGYSGIGYLIDGIKALPIAKKGGSEYVPATAEMAGAGKYPLARFLYIYVNKAPGESLSEAEMEWIKIALSNEGQAVVKKAGYVPLTEKHITKELAKIQ